MDCGPDCAGQAVPGGAVRGIILASAVSLVLIAWAVRYHVRAAVAAAREAR